MADFLFFASCPLILKATAFKVAYNDSQFQTSNGQCLVAIKAAVGASVRYGFYLYSTFCMPFCLKFVFKSVCIPSSAALGHVNLLPT